jgi:hypothetical protein
MTAIFLVAILPIRLVVSFGPVEDSSVYRLFFSASYAEYGIRLLDFIIEGDQKATLTVICQEFGAKQEMHVYANSWGG